MKLDVKEIFLNDYVGKEVAEYIKNEKYREYVSIARDRGYTGECSGGFWSERYGLCRLGGWPSNRRK